MIRPDYYVIRHVVFFLSFRFEFRQCGVSRFTYFFFFYVWRFCRAQSCVELNSRHTGDGIYYAQLTFFVNINFSIYLHYTEMKNKTVCALSRVSIIYYYNASRVGVLEVWECDNYFGSVAFLFFILKYNTRRYNIIMLFTYSSIMIGKRCTNYVVEIKYFTVKSIYVLICSLKKPFTTIYFIMYVPVI